MTKLNANEMAVLKAAADEIQNCTGGEFGYLDDAAKPEGMGKEQFAGYCSQLCQKGMLLRDGEFGSVMISEAGVDALRKAGHFTGDAHRMFEVYDRNGDWV